MERCSKILLWARMDMVVRNEILSHVRVRLSRVTDPYKELSDIFRYFEMIIRDENHKRWLELALLTGLGRVVGSRGGWSLAVKERGWSSWRWEWHLDCQTCRPDSLSFSEHFHQWKVTWKEHDPVSKKDTVDSEEVERALGRSPVVKLMLEFSSDPAHSFQREQIWGMKFLPGQGPANGCFQACLLDLDKNTIIYAKIKYRSSITC